MISQKRHKAFQNCPKCTTALIIIIVVCLYLSRYVPFSLSHPFWLSLFLFYKMTFSFHVGSNLFLSFTPNDIVSSTPYQPMPFTVLMFYRTNIGVFVSGRCGDFAERRRFAFSWGVQSCCEHNCVQFIYMNRCMYVQIHREKKKPTQPAIVQCMRVCLSVSTVNLNIEPKRVWNVS